MESAPRRFSPKEHHLYDSPSSWRRRKEGLGILGAGGLAGLARTDRMEAFSCASGWAFDLDSGIYLVRPSKAHTRHMWARSAIGSLSYAPTGRHGDPSALSVDGT